MLFLVLKLLIVWSEWKEIVIISTIWAAIVGGFCSLSLVTFADGPGEDGKGCPGGHSDESLILKHGIYRAQMNGWFGSLLVNNQIEWFENQLIVIRKWFVIKSRCHFGNIISKTVLKAGEALGKGKDTWLGGSLWHLAARLSADTQNHLGLSET